MSVENKQKQDCCGCNACAEICPAHCIEMIFDKVGFQYPSVKSSLCIECGACERVCPIPACANDFQYPISAYAAKMNDSDMQIGSSSGGAATAISRIIIGKGGVVYGCSINGLNCTHIRVDNIEDLVKLRGSKYVQSDVRKVFCQVKSDLKAGRSVVFIGTPCQVYALKKFLNTTYPNLLLVDLICHGTPSQQMLSDHVKSVTSNKKIDSISFRTGNSYTLSVRSKGKEIWKADVWSEPMKDMYFRAFMDGITYRPSCNTCPFGRSERTSDITLGDFWGLKDHSIFPAHPILGTSVILPNTEKGEKFTQLLSDEMTLIERPITEAVEGNTQLRHPVSQTKTGKLFFLLYPHIQFDKALRIVYLCSRLSAGIKKIVKRCQR